MSKRYTDHMRSMDYKEVFGTPTGERVLTDIMVKANVFKAIETADPLMAARAEGARWLALHIASFKRFDAKSFMQSWKAPEEV